MSDGTSSLLREIWIALRDGFDPGTRLGGAIYGSAIMAGMLRGERWTIRVLYAAGSVPTAYYTAQLLSAYISDSAGLQGVYGFVSGVFALRMLQRLFLAAEQLDGSTLLGRILDRVIGPLRHRPDPPQ